MNKEIETSSETRTTRRYRLYGCLLVTDDIAGTLSLSGLGWSVTASLSDLPALAELLAVAAEEG